MKRIGVLGGISPPGNPTSPWHRQIPASLKDDALATASPSSATSHRTRPRLMVSDDRPRIGRSRSGE